MNSDYSGFCSMKNSKKIHRSFDVFEICLRIFERYFLVSHIPYGQIIPCSCIQTLEKFISNWTIVLLVICKSLQTDSNRNQFKTPIKEFPKSMSLLKMSRFNTKIKNWTFL